MPREQFLRVRRQFENLHALFQERLVGLLVAIDLALQAPLLPAPLTGEAVVEISADLAVELVHVHGVNAVIESLVFRLKAGDRLLMLAALVGMTGLKRFAHPTQDLVVEAQPAE